MDQILTIVKSTILKPQPKQFGLALALFIIIDLIWFQFAAPSYRSLVQGVQGDEMSLNYIGALIAYILMACAVVFFTLPRVNLATKAGQGALMAAVLSGGLYGFLSYGMFNFTNMAIFDRWNLGTSLVDSFWGAIIFTLTTFLTHVIGERFLV